ncbi:hypothetical protein RJZ57_001072, partial [Blastomyces gilchristii]
MAGDITDWKMEHTFWCAISSSIHLPYIPVVCELTYHTHQPNDKREQDRMDLLHFIYRHVLDRRLYCAPIKRNPGRVLDLGTGTGSWAVEFA